MGAALYESDAPAVPLPNHRGQAGPARCSPPPTPAPLPARLPGAATAQPGRRAGISARSGLQRLVAHGQ
jgi:hypothetical protein